MPRGQLTLPQSSSIPEDVGRLIADMPICHRDGAEDLVPVKAASNQFFRLKSRAVTSNIRFIITFFSGQTPGMCRSAPAAGGRSCSSAATMLRSIQPSIQYVEC